jgi:hypothetical protein
MRDPRHLAAVTMRPARKPSALEWLVCVGAFLGGAAFLWLDLSGRTRGSTPENELAVAEAVAANVSESMVRGIHYLKFTVVGYAIEYDGAQPQYQEVRSAVQSGRPIRVWVSKRNEAPIPIGHSVTLYKLHARNRPVLTYSEVAAYRAKQEYAVPIVGGVLMALGGFCTLGCVYTQRRYVLSNRIAETATLPPPHDNEHTTLDAEAATMPCHSQEPK